MRRAAVVYTGERKEFHTRTPSFALMNLLQRKSRARSAPGPWTRSAACQAGCLPGAVNGWVVGLEGRSTLTRKGIDAMYKACNKRGERRGEAPVMTRQKLVQTRAGQTRGRRSRTRRHRTPRERWEEARGGAAATTDYGGPVTRRRRADDGEAEQSRRARRGREQDVAEISRRMYEEIRGSRDPRRDHVEDG